MADSRPPQRNRCLYEVLGVPRDASPEEIRAAYKRLALRLHPDKQHAASSAEAATADFQELRHAYEVLSDPRERAWYDSHRSRILFSDPDSHKHSSFFDLDLFAFFSNSAFSGYADSGKGFYKVYGDVFAKIHAAELRFAKQMGLGADAVPPAPLIGNLDSPYTQVVAFYNHWLGFATVMDFAWADEYDASMGPNRRSRRAMEEENKKVRRKARREYNDTVRGLAAFAKKRDKRVVDMTVKKSQEEEKRRAEEKARKKEEERKRMERARMYEEPEWARVDEEEEEFEETGDDDSRKKKGSEEFHCVVCNKKFKSEKQWKNHEQSKKHRDRVAELRMAFEEEEEKVIEAEEAEEAEEGEDGEEGVHVGFDYEPPESDYGDAVDELCEELKDEVRLQEDGNDAEDSKHGDRNLDLDDEASILEAMVSGRRNRRNDSVGRHDSSPTDAGRAGNNEDSSAPYDNRRKGRRNRASKREAGAEPDTEVVREDKIKARQEESAVQNQACDGEDDKQGPSCSLEEDVTRSKGGRAIGKSQKPKKKQVVGKGAGNNDATAELKNSSKGRKQKGTSKAPGNACGTCGEIFESRNKLFAHLGDTGHAMLKSR